MKRLLILAVAAVASVTLSQCGSSSTYTPPPQQDSGPGSIVLSVNNFDVWCTLTVNGETQTAQSGSYTFDAGTVVPLTAVGNPSFTFNFWTGTDGANASNGGHDPNASTTVTMTASKQVLACCDNASERCVSSPGYP
jgi:hypothetical protein